MREFRTDPIMNGDHILIDEDEYLAVKAIGKMCDLCAFNNSNKCENIPCNGVIFKRVEKVPTCRPYKDTEEMIADYKERFNVSKGPDFCMPLIWVKCGSICSLIMEITPKDVLIYCNKLSMKDLFVGYTYLDGSPCGKVEE